MPQLLKLFFSSCLLTSGFAHRAMAGGSMEHFFSDEELLFHYGAVAVAEVIAIVDPDADTNKNPPKLAIQITEVISVPRNTRHSGDRFHMMSIGVARGQGKRLNDGAAA